jgi:hypothetical protein
MIGELQWSFEKAFLGFSVLGVFTGASSWLPAILIRKIGVRGTMLAGIGGDGRGLPGPGQFGEPARYWPARPCAGVGFQMAALIPGTHVLSALFASAPCRSGSISPSARWAARPGRGWR